MRTEVTPVVDVANDVVSYMSVSQSNSHDFPPVRYVVVRKWTSMVYVPVDVRDVFRLKMPCTLLIDEINEDEDSLRFYFLGKNWRRRVEHIGAKPSIDPEGPLIV